MKTTTTTRRTGRLLAALAFTLAATAGRASAGYDGYTLAQWNPRWDTRDIYNVPGIQVKQPLPVGDMMRLTLTDAAGNTIKNSNGTTPTLEGTVAPGTEGIAAFVPGIINGKPVKDMHQTHWDPIASRGGSSGTLELAAFTEDGPAAIGSWLYDNGYVTDNPFSVPDFIGDAGDLYYGIDAVLWQADGFIPSSSMFGQTYDVVNGVSTALPGVLFSSSPLTHSDSEWMDDSRTLFNGTVTLDSLHQLSVPTPGTLSCIGIAGLLAFRRRR